MLPGTELHPDILFLGALLLSGIGRQLNGKK